MDSAAAGRTMRMKILDADRVAECLDYDALIEALRSGLTGTGSSPSRMRLETGSADDRKLLLVKPAWDDDVAIVKLLTLNEMNRQTEQPFIQGVIVVFDQATGSPSCVMDARELTCRRTAAASALAADYLAVRDAEVLTLIGTGTMAPHMALAHAVNRPIRRVNVFGRSLEKAEATANAIRSANPAINACAAADLPTAVGEAQIVCAATSSSTPVVKGAWISNGAHIDLVGSYRPDTRESDDAAIGMARVFVDDRAGAMSEAGDILIPFEKGVISQSDVIGDLAELCGGVVQGRISEEEVTAFKSVGMALEDLIAVKLVIGNA